MKRNKITKKYNTSYIDNTPNQKPILIVLIAILVLVIVTFVTITVFISRPPNENGNNPLATPDEIVANTTPDETATPNSTSETAEVEQTDIEVSDYDQPQELTELLSAVGNTYGELSAYDCSQLVTVNASGTEAEIKLWECADGVWAESEYHTCYGFVGSMGTVDNMSEDISGTPRGLYSIGSAFYRNTEPVTRLDTFEITEDTYWVDDPNSQFYNQRVEGTMFQDWNSAEHMIEYSVYDYGFVVNYNIPVVYNAGSAIFFHIGSSPTAGCIATSEDMVLSYLSALDHSLSPYILIN